MTLLAVRATTQRAAAGEPDTMSTIAVLTGEHDDFHRRGFLLQHLFPHWIEAGHFVVVHVGDSEPPPADMAILHVDLTVIPPEYERWLSRYPVVVNGAALDISKRRVSRSLVRLGDGYAGPVIVKTNANSGALPELAWARREAQKSGRPAVPPRHIAGSYPLFDSPSRVPPSVWGDEALVVERFLPERDEEGYALRVYIFFGDYERCSRVTHPDPIVKGAGSTKRVRVPVPPEIRGERRRLGLDYGKLDFAIHDGVPVLFDANRTPTMPSGSLQGAVSAENQALAEGIESFLRPRDVTRQKA